MSKLYLEERFPMDLKNPRKLVVGVSENCLAFGCEISPNVEQFFHFGREDWKKIKGFIDEEIRKEKKKKEQGL